MVDGISSLMKRSKPPLFTFMPNLYGVVHSLMWNWTDRKEVSILLSEVKKKSILLLTIVTNE